MTVKIDGTNTVANPAFTGADTDTGLQCGTNELKLVTGGTARATIDDSGRLMLGTTTEGEHTADDLTVATSGDTGISIRSGTSSSGKLFFSDGTSSADEYRGFIQYSHSNNAMSFGTDSTERMQILSDGTIRLASGCPGIDFSQIQTNASGMTSETLDSYEEGTWTPGVVTGTVNSSDARYIKIGNLVKVCASLTGFSDRSSSNIVQINNVPFSSSQGSQAAGSMFGRYLDRTAYTSYVKNNGGVVEFYSIGSGNFTSLQHQHLNSASVTIYFQASWIIS
jgi:hypothetical protein